MTWPISSSEETDGPITWTDLVRGDITFESENVPDYALCRANGDPLYTLVNPVDDALMHQTPGVGSFLSGGIVAAVMGVAYGLALYRILLRRPPERSP